MSASSEVRIRVVAHKIGHVSDVRQRLAAVADCDGWVQYASVCVVHRAGAEASAAPRGFPLAAEFVRGATSFSLRRDGDGWLWTELTERTDGDREGEGDVRCRVRDASFISTERSLSLRYRVLWRQDEAQQPVAPWEPWVSRFVGWSTSTEEAAS